MAAPVQVWNAPVRALPFSLDSSQVEALKWLGLICMLIAHWAEYVGGVVSGWPINVGQLAFPLFVVALAVSVAEDVTGRSERLVWRLLPFAIAAQVFASPLRDGTYLNVLFQFMAIGAWVHADTIQDASGRWSLRLAALVVSLVSEFSWPGLLLGVGAVRYFQWENPRYFWWLVLPGLALVAVTDSGLYYPVALCVLGLVARCWRWRVPRIGGMFASAYVGQFVLFLAARGVMS